VEEYSIDEAFVDLTGLRRICHGPYGMIAKNMQDTVQRELGFSVSVGVSLTKVLAKIASKYKKPHGLVIIPGGDIHLYLQGLPVERVWGIGPNTSAFLRKFNIKTALDFARKDEAFVLKRLSKPYHEIWHELNGRSVYPVTTEGKETYKSISKTKTFTPARGDEEFVFAQMVKNLENACIKARRHDLSATGLIVFLRTQDFRDAGIDIKLSRPTAYPAELLGPMKECFLQIYSPQNLYRRTGVALSGLVPQKKVQCSLFDDVVKIEKMSRVYEAIDSLAERFGKHTVHLGASLPTRLQAQHDGARGDVPQRKTALFRGENKRQRLGLPLLHIKV
jgi:DNA polymerase-4/DNA polymerase V